VKLFFILSLLSLVVYADKLSLDLYAISHHLKAKNRNENHQWRGISYTFLEKENYQLKLEYSNFINSFYNKTQIIALTDTYMIYKNYFGLSGSIGYQKGYKMDDFGSIGKDTKNKDDKSFIFLYYFYFQFKKVYITYTYVSKSVEALRVGMIVLSW